MTVKGKQKMVLEVKSKPEELEVLVHTIITSLVDKPNEVKVTTAHGQHSSVLEVHVAKEDIGKVIGRKGSTAHAIRLILNNAAGKQKTNAVLQIIEPDRAFSGKKVVNS